MPEYEFEETKLRCPKCEKGKVRLVISRKEGKEYKFFRCSEYDCDWNGGFYNQDNNKIDIIDNCPSCDGILYVRNGKKGPFLGCSHFPKCKQTRDLTDEEAKLLESKTEKNLDNFVEESKDSPQEKDADLNDASHQIFQGNCSQDIGKGHLIQPRPEFSYFFQSRPVTFHSCRTWFRKDNRNGFENIEIYFRR